MKYGRLLAAGLSLIAGAVGTVLAAAHTKKDLIDIRREKLEEFFGEKDGKTEKAEEEMEESEHSGEQ